MPVREQPLRMLPVVREMTTERRLTSFSHGAGCGCKLGPDDLRTVLAGVTLPRASANLLVAADTGDDAAVYRLPSGEGLIATLDFFTPIVDDPYDFGRIAAANALSDIYAMGGTPVVAINLVGWPRDVLPGELLTEVLREEWGFTGFVTSDWVFGTHDAVGSLEAGMDVEMPLRLRRAHELPAALRDGTLHHATVLRSARRILRTTLLHAATRTDLAVAVQLALIARFYERIGDHAVNIGEWVQYAATGELPNPLAKAKDRFDTGGDPAEG